MTVISCFIPWLSVCPSVCAENQNFEIVTSSPLVIPAGDESVTVVINILNDTIFEGNKTFALRLLTLTAQEDVDMSPILGSATVTTVSIIEDDMSKFKSITIG